MTAPLERERPRAARYWGKVWGVHWDTARKLLRWLHRQYGSKVVWTTGRGPKKVLVATPTSLGFLKVTRADRFIFCVAPIPMQTTPPGQNPAGQIATPQQRVSRAVPEGDEYVTQEQHSRALAEVWKAIAETKGPRR